ncbi:MAG: hypothetical protein HY996_03270 [Micrococcales bacterium]|nr:hypothetical protein [Micrococcales bacterium]
MPRVPEPLPDELHRPFRVRDARTAGVADARLRRSDLVRTFHGARTFPAVDGITGYAVLLRPGERFSHTTAAAVYGAPLPRGAEDVLHVLASEGVNRARRPGVVGHRGAGQAVLLSGVPVSTPLDLVCELATLLPLEDLVAVVDHLVLRPRVPDGTPRPFTELADLRASLARRSGRGIRRAREAAEQAREGAESRRETWLRLLCVDAGLPEPVCNAPLFDTAGRVGWFDLVWRRWRVAAEYDGDQHRTSDVQYDRDIRRFDRAAAIDWRVVRVRNEGYRRPTETRERLVAAFRAQGWRPGA